MAIFQYVPLGTRQDTFEVYDGDACLGMVWRNGVDWHAHPHRLDPQITEATRDAAAERLRTA